MKKILFFSAIAVSLFIGCEKNSDLSVEQKDKEAAQVTAPSATLSTTFPATSEASCAGPYNIALESVINNGNSTWTWTWSVTNPNPGNGSNGTLQNLSHWDITLGQCVLFTDVVSGATSVDGTTWVPFTPTFEQDPSILNTCNIATGAVLKFNLGTAGTAKSYYSLTITENVQVDPSAVAYYKGGGNTGCGQICFPGLGCKVEGPLEGCSFSQGYWFSKPGVVWPDVNGADAGVITIGGKFYTEAEGRAIWNTSNAGGISDAKKGFCQVAAILLSGDDVFPTATVWPYVTTVQNWLSTKAKLSATGAGGTLKVQPKSAATTNAAAGSAAGSIGNWINVNHCDAL